MSSPEKRKKESCVNPLREGQKDLGKKPPSGEKNRREGDPKRFIEKCPIPVKARDLKKGGVWKDAAFGRKDSWNAESEWGSYSTEIP